jgi:hypothetical protein
MVDCDSNINGAMAATGVCRGRQVVYIQNSGTCYAHAAINAILMSPVRDMHIRATERLYPRVSLRVQELAIKLVDGLTQIGPVGSKADVHRLLERTLRFCRRDADELFRQSLAKVCSNMRAFDADDRHVRIIKRDTSVDLLYALLCRKIDPLFGKRTGAVDFGGHGDDYSIMHTIMEYAGRRRKGDIYTFEGEDSAVHVSTASPMNLSTGGVDCGAVSGTYSFTGLVNVQEPDTNYLHVGVRRSSHAVAFANANNGLRVFDSNSRGTPGGMAEVLQRTFPHVVDRPILDGESDVAYVHRTWLERRVGEDEDEDREQAEPVGERSIKMHATIYIVNNPNTLVGGASTPEDGGEELDSREKALLAMLLVLTSATEIAPEPVLEVPVVAEVPVAGAYDGAYQAGVGESENVASGEASAAGGNGKEATAPVTAWVTLVLATAIASFLSR